MNYDLYQVRSEIRNVTIEPMRAWTDNEVKDITWTLLRDIVWASSREATEAAGFGSTLDLINEL